MAASTSYTLNEEGKLLLEKIQDAFLEGKAVTHIKEHNGNVKYTNASLDPYVLPLLKHLDFKVRLNPKR